MPALQLENPTLKDFFEDYTHRLKEPEWLLEFRKMAFKRLSQLELPHSGLEPWRKVSLTNLDLNQYLNSVSNLPLPEINYNGSGVNIYPISSVPPKLTYWVSRELGSILEKHSNNYFALLSLSFFNCGYLVDIPENSSLADGLELKHTIPEDYSNAIFPLGLIKVGAFSKLNMLEVQSSIKEGDSLDLVVPFTYLHVEESCSVELSSVEKFNPSTFHFRTIHAYQKKASQLLLCYSNFNGYKGKTFVYSELQEPEAFLKCIGVGATVGREQQDIETSIYHHASQTQSTVDFRAIVKDKSHHIFTGNLVIPKTSKNVITNQINHNLMLNKSARAESNPKLEVLAEDVQCSHGATVGEVPEEQLFYLQSRGLKLEEAKALIIEGFISFIIDQISFALSKRSIEIYLKQKLGISDHG